MRRYISSDPVTDDYRYRFMKKSHSIPWNDIICFSKAGNNVDIIVSNTDDPYPVHTTMKNIRKEAKAKGFVDCTSSYMVNLQHIENIDGRYICLSGHKKVTGGQRALKNVIDARQEYLLRS